MTERADREQAAGLAPTFTDALAGFLPFRIGYPTMRAEPSPRRLFMQRFVHEVRSAAALHDRARLLRPPARAGSDEDVIAGEWDLAPAVLGVVPVKRIS